MNEEKFKEYIKEMARIEFENNIKNNLDSSIIFKYIQSLEQENQQLKSVLNEVKEECETKFLETELYGGELVCIAVENYKKIKTMLDKGSDK